MQLKFVLISSSYVALSCCVHLGTYNAPEKYKYSIYYVMRSSAHEYLIHEAGGRTNKLLLPDGYTSDCIDVNYEDDYVAVCRNPTSFAREESKGLILVYNKELGKCVTLQTEYKIIRELIISDRGRTIYFSANKVSDYQADIFLVRYDTSTNTQVALYKSSSMREIKLDNINKFIYFTERKNDESSLLVLNSLDGVSVSRFKGIRGAVLGTQCKKIAISDSNKVYIVEDDYKIGMELGFNNNIMNKGSFFHIGCLNNGSDYIITKSADGIWGSVEVYILNSSGDDYYVDRKLSKCGKICAIQRIV